MILDDKRLNAKISQPEGRSCMLGEIYFIKMVGKVAFI